jgi:hypothetical protein
MDKFFVLLGCAFLAIALLQAVVPSTGMRNYIKIEKGQKNIEKICTKIPKMSKKNIKRTYRPM